MAKKRKRIIGKRVAWSNGEKTLIPPSQLRELKADYYKQLDEYHTRVEEGREWEIDEPAVMRGDSRLTEAYSDRLWELDMHVESMRWLLEAAQCLIDEYYVYIDNMETNYYHRNFRRFRYLVRRCEERCKEDSSLKRMYECSTVFNTYLYMEKIYAGCKGWGFLL